MESYRVERTIGAAPSQVWAVLVDGASWTTWDSGVEKLEGTIAEGQKVKVYSAASPGRAFPVKVALDPMGHTMTWTGGMPFGLFKGVRTFTLTSAGDGTRFVMEEVFSGPLVGMIWKRMPDLTASFEQFADGLKARAEKG